MLNQTLTLTGGGGGGGQFSSGHRWYYIQNRKIDHSQDVARIYIYIVVCGVDFKNVAIWEKSSSFESYQAYKTQNSSSQMISKIFLIIFQKKYKKHKKHKEKYQKKTKTAKRIHRKS